MSEGVMQFGQAARISSNPQVDDEPSLRQTGIASVEIHGTPGAALAAWRDLAAVAAVSPYQMPGWLLPWLDTIGVASGVLPMFVIAKARDGTPLAMLPFGLTRRGPFTVAAFLGGRDSNFNMGLFRPGQGWTRETVADLLRRAAAADGRRVDAFVLVNQPEGWDGVANPLALLDHQPSPSFAYKVALTRDPDAFLRGRLSREARKKLRQKMRKLRASGAVTVRRAETAAEIAETLDAFVAQRRARNEACGLSTTDLPTLRAFLERAASGQPGTPASVEFHALRRAGRVIATFGGARRRDRFSGMLMSFADDPELARMSPGDILLAEVIKGHCGAGMTCFDLGIGEARYKSAYCPEVEPLFDSLVPMTRRGRLYAGAERARLSAKRTIKQSRWAWPLMQWLRRQWSRPSGGRPAQGAVVRED